MSFGEVQRNACDAILDEEDACMCRMGMLSTQLAGKQGVHWLGVGHVL